MKFGAWLAEASLTINLTRILDPEDMAVRHFLDSYQLLKVLKKVKDPVLDAGCGGGVPGIPLAIFRRDIRVVMVDGTAKKIRYVKEWIEALKLQNASAFAERAEEHLRKKRYHAIISRAAVKPESMFEILGSTGPVASRLIFMEGAAGKEKARQLRSQAKQAKYVFDLALPYRLPGLDKERFLICFKRR
ncbi:MAG: 16S rRNA (guanine(527)-N(7))-methyltransferase RsmG [Planctomycetota bacterium]